jgi:hypothetical protein
MWFEATFCGAKVKLWRTKYRRVLEWIGGDAARGIPVTIVYRGPKRRVLAEKKRLERYGYKVAVRREKS